MKPLAKFAVSVSSLLLIALAPIASQARLIECSQVPDLFKIFITNHYAHRAITDEIRERTVEQFIKSLDPSRTTLLQADVDKLKKDLPKLFTTMSTGNCSLLDDVYKMMVSRTKENEEYVRTYVTPTFKIDDSIQFMLDPDKRGYMKTQAERETLAKAMINWQLSNYLLAKPSMEEARKQLTHRYELITKRISERKSAELVSMFAEAFTHALDPHTAYLPKDESDDFQIQMQLSLEGIGVSLTSQDGYVVIEEIIPGGSADRANALKPQDKIIAVAQATGTPVSVIDMDLRDVVKMIRGKKGTEVKLTVLRQMQKAETLNISLIRDKVDIKESAAKFSVEPRTVGGKKLKIGILELPAFYGGRERGARSSYKDMFELLNKARAEKVDGLILDLSRNGGGLLDDAVKISGYFIKKGPIVATKGLKESKEVLSDEDEDTIYNGPLLVLTSRLSASASEIFAGALKDYKRALIVGSDHTFGKGSVQVFSGLPMDLGAMKITTGMYFLPGGDSTQHKGVASDILLPSLFATDTMGEKNLDYSLPPVSIEPFMGTEINASEAPKHWKEVDTALIKRLAEASKKRVAQDPKFQEIQKEIAEMEKNKGIVKIADLRKKSEADKVKMDQEKKKNNGRRRTGIDMESPSLQESIRIMADWLTG